MAIGKKLAFMEWFTIVSDYKVSPCTHTHAHQLQETSKALEVIGKPFEQWHSVLHDQWNVAGILGGITYGADGLPFITSHYGYFMSSWHIVMALSGQIANMTEKSLTFAPRLDPPYSLPIFLPAVWGHLQAGVSTSSSSGVPYTVSLEFGSLELTQLAVLDCKFPHSPFTLSSSTPATWLCQFLIISTRSEVE